MVEAVDKSDGYDQADLVATTGSGFTAERLTVDSVDSSGESAITRERRLRV